MIELGGYEFEGVYTDPKSQIRHRPGVYAVICLVNDEPHCVLDFGTSSKLQDRLQGGHDRKSCWRDSTHGKIGYCVKYTANVPDFDPQKHAPPAVRRSNDSSIKDRLLIENELFWKYDVPCGVNHWVQKEEMIRSYRAYESQFGERSKSNKIE